jgi:hypothetical protein
LLGVLCLASPGKVAAQLAVIDTANLIQAGYQVARLIEMLGLSRQDLSALANAGQLITVLTRLQAVANQMITLMDAVEARAFGWQGLAAMNPCSGTALANWNHQAASWARQGVSLMSQVTSISSATLNLLNELMMLITSIVGTTSGLQTVTGLLAQAVTETQSLRTAAIPFHQDMQGGRIIEHVNQIATICLQRGLLNGWGTTRQWW